VLAREAATYVLGLNRSSTPSPSTVR